MTACCRRVIAQSILAALVYIAAAEDLRQDTTVDWFIERLSRGDQLSDTDAVFHLRNRLMNQTTLKPLAPFTKKMMLTTAWNRTVLGEPTKKSQMWLRSTGPHKSKMPEKILLTEEAQFEIETQSASLV